MRKILLSLCVLGALVDPGAFRVWAATDPGDQFLDAYFQIQDGEAAERLSNWEVAQAKYSAALATLNAIKGQQPDWYPTLLEFRRKFCEDHLAAVKAKLPATPPAAAPVVVATPAVEAAPPTSPTEQIRQLQEELQRAKEQYQQLQQNRDALAARLESKLKEPAPSDRATAQQTLEQLRELRAVYDTAKTQLEAATAKAARADTLATQLSQALQKIHALETSRAELNTKLQAALAAAPTAPTGAPTEELLKKNSDLTAQLAAAQAEITKIRDQLTAVPAGAPSAETAKVRADLDQIKSQLQLRTDELSATRQRLDMLQADNTNLKLSQDEMLARLIESDRQLRAAKASTAKNDQIIQQLRKENALLRQIADRRLQPGRPRGTPTQPANKSGGFLWFKSRPQAAATGTDLTPPAVSQSEAGRFTATVQAPEPPESAPAKPVAPLVAPSVKPPVKATPAPAPAPPSTDTLLNEGRTALAAKDYDTAAVRFQGVLVQDANNAAALSGLGTTLYYQGKSDEAEETLRRAVAVSPNESQIRALLGMLCIRKGKSDEAYSELTRAVALDPRNAEAHNYLGIVMSEKGWGAAGEQEIQRAVELNPQYADAHFNLAVLYARQKNPRFDLARSHYQKAIDLGAAHDPQLETLLKVAPAAK